MNAIKKFLIQKKKKYPKIHPLDTLWEMCNDIDESFEEIKENSVFLTTFYTPTRYPGDCPEFSWQEAEKAFEAATQIKNFVLNKIKNK